MRKRIRPRSVIARLTRVPRTGVCQSVNSRDEVPHQLSPSLSVFSIFPLLCLMTLGGVLWQIQLASWVQAQTTTAISSDGTMGTQVSSVGNIHDITGGTRPGAGPNLFHSFAKFSVGEGHTANFLNDTGLNTSNVLSRVTGGNSSNIFGTLKTTDFPGANLFLLNPAGVLFGPNASVDVSGSFYITTADFIRLGESGIFYADLDKESVLTTAPPESFGFLYESPLGITLNRSSLKVKDGETLSLIGGGITIVGNPDQASDETSPSLKAEGGRVNLVSVASAGEVEHKTPDVKVDSFEDLGEISLSENAFIDTSGEGGGTVVIQGGRLTVDQSRISASTIGPTEGAFNSEPGLGIDISVTEELVLDNGSAIETNVFTNIEGLESGGVRVKAQQVEIRNMAFIESIVRQGSTGGKSGDIEVEANILRIQNGDQDFSDNTIGSIRVGTFSSSNGGTIILNATDTLEVRNGGQVITFTDMEGDAGDIKIDAGTVLLAGGDSPAFTGVVSQTDRFRPFQSTTGNAGNIRLTANQLKIDNAQISTATFTSGKGGNVEVAVEGGEVLISGSPNRPQGIFANTQFGSGTGGNLQLTAHNLKLTNLASLQAATGGGSGAAGDVIVTLTGNLELQPGSFIQTRAVSGATGDAGDLTITAGDIEVIGISDATKFEVSPEFTGISTQTFSGQGGNLTIEANNLTVRDKAFVNTATTGSGDSGDLTIDLSGNLEVANGGQIFGDAQIGSSGDAGDINIQADNIILTGANSTPSIRLDGSTLPVIRSAITSQSRGEGGKAGNIQVTAQRLSILDRASITTESISTGNAGSIDIRADDTILVDNGSVTTQAANALGGNIKLDAGKLIQLTDSQVTSRVQEGSGEAGSISLDPDFIVIQNSEVLSTAVLGNGGPISLVANSAILVDTFSRLDASSQFGGNGIIDIQAPIQNLSGAIAPLPEEAAPVTMLYSARCAAGQGGNFSTFVDSKRDSISPTPGTFLASPLLNLAPTAHAVADRSVGQRAPVILTASIVPLVLGHAGELTTACP